MKNLKLSIALLASSALLFSCGNEASTKTEESTKSEAAHAHMGSGSHMIDTENSTVIWKGTMLGIKTHEGKVPFEYGKIDFTDGQITGGEFVVDLTSIKPTDENYDENKTKDKLIGHLQSPDFFDVANYPTAKFEITSASETELKGNLTVRGNTHEEVAEITKHDGAKHEMMVNLTFDRNKYGVNFSTGAEDMVISDDIELKIKLKVDPAGQTAEK